MIVRVIIFFLIFFMLWYLLRLVRSLIEQRSQQVNKSNKTTPKEEQMVVCKSCGVYTPTSHAIRTKSGDFYCCKEHYQQDNN